MKMTIGCNVHLHHNGAQNPGILYEDQPFTGTIACDHGDSTVNLQIVNHLGESSTAKRVQFVSKGDEAAPPPVGTMFTGAGAGLRV